MTKKEKKEKGKPNSDGVKLVADNRKARHNFDIIDTLECGIVLVGSEVKSLRAGKISLEEAYGRLRENEVWLIGCDIAEYAQATAWQHEPKRPRKLLLHQREVRKFARQAHEKGLTLVPLKVYFNERGIAKVLLGLCRGRKLHDKREKLRKEDQQRDIQRVIRRNRS
jgi:SsrA-binding protein